MNDINMEERIAIRDTARTLKKYGSTSSYSKRHDAFIKHQVTKSDTLQGLALKYGVTTEEIRRVNRLWTNDSLFLRETLLIPCMGGGGCSSRLTSPDLVQGAASPQTPNGTTSLDPTEDSYSDFLVRIDCSIASTKSQVISAQGNSEFIDDDVVLWKRKTGPSSRLRRSSDSGSEHSSTGGGGGVSTRPNEVVVMTQSRRVRNSLQRLEQERDEIFEL